MTQPYTLFKDIAAEIEVPPNGILSRTVFNNDHMKVVVFGMDKGQELSEHTAAMPAVVHVLEGEASLRLGGDVHDAAAGTWIHMPPNLAHSVTAVTPLIMVLTLIKKP